MKKTPRSFLQLLNIQPGEERVVGLLIVLASFVGLARIFNTTAASTLFLQTFESSYLPYCYMLMAVVTPLIGYINTRFEDRVPFAKLHLYNLVGYLIVLGILRLAMSLTDAGWPVFIYFIWSDIGWIFFSLMLWGMAGRLLNVRQAKRLFGLIGASGGVATIIMGFFISGVVHGIGVSNLLLLVMFVISAAIVTLIYIGRNFSNQLTGSDTGETDTTSDSPTAWQFPRKYIYLLVVMSMLAEATFYFMDIIFYDQLQIRYSSQEGLSQIPLSELRVEQNIFIVKKSSEVELAGFMGTYLAAMNLLVLISNFFLVAPMIGKLGMRRGLLVLPVMTGLVAIVFGVSGVLGAPMLFLFRVAVLNSMLDWILRDTIFRSTVLILYQPLPPSARTRTQTQVETIAMPFAQGITGLVLAGLGAIGFASLEYNWVLLGILVFLMFLAFALGNAYGPVLLEVLSKRSLKLSGQSLALNDPSTRSIFLRELDSPYPEVVSYALNTLEEMEYPVQNELHKLLNHSVPAVRRDVLLRIARLKLPELYDDVRKMMAEEKNALVKVAGIHALSALSDEYEVDDLESHYDENEPSLFIAAMVNLIRKYDQRKDLITRLDALLMSSNAAERSIGLQIIAELGNGDKYAGYVLNALNDEAVDVRRNAVLAAIILDVDELWSAVLDSLNDVYIRTATVNALISRKETILPRIRQWLNSPSASQVARVTCLKILGKIQDPRAIPDLLTYLADANVEFRHESMVSLHRCGYRFDPRDLDLFKKALYLEIAGAIHVASLQADSDAMDNPMLLFDALEVAWKHHRERVFLLLRMLYDPSLVQRVLDNLDLGSPEKRAYALEVLDTALADEFKALIFPLLEDLGYARRLELWNRSLKLVGISNLIKVDTILDSPPTYSLELFTPWVKSCVIQALFTDPRYRDKIGNLQDENRLVQNTLDWTKAFLSKKEKTMLSIIERVMILKTVSIFGETPDYLLAEIANLLEEQHFKSGETFIHKGDPANCMYIIVNGDIKIHDGDREFNHLGARDIVGEMAVLDQIPRSASATTVIPTHLLKLDRAPLFELIADRAEVAQGIIRVLVGRLRTTMNSTAK